MIDQQLKTMAVLKEDHGLIPSMYMVGLESL